MSILRSIIRPSEITFRQRQVAARTFWQKESNIPTYVRGKGDAAGLFVIISGLVVCLGVASDRGRQLVFGKDEE